MKLPRIEFKPWSMELWGDTSVLEIRICRCWDGLFIVDSDKRVLPRWGYRREDRVQLRDATPNRHTMREVRGWRLWFPYVMIWHMHNFRDNTMITVADDDPRAGTTKRIR